MKTSGSKLLSIKLAQILFYLSAVIWSFLGLISLGNLASQDPALRVVFAAVALLMFGNAGAMLLAGRRLARRNKWALLFALAVLSLNLLLTFIDQFGIIDFITAMLDMFIVAILVANWETFFTSAEPPAGER